MSSLAFVPLRSSKAACNLVARPSFRPILAAIPPIWSSTFKPSRRAQLFYRAKPIFFGRPFRAAPVLPESIGECRDVLLLSIVSGPVGAMPGRGLLMVLLWKLVGLVGML